MNKDQEYPSDSDQSDEDFCPDNESVSDILSNEESDYKGSSDSEIEQSNGKSSKKSTKRKKSKSKGQKSKSSKEDETENVKESSGAIVNEEEEKKRSDDLWASFLSDVNGTTNDSSSVSETNAEKKKSNVAQTQSKDKSDECKDKKEEVKTKVTEVLEFAGEQIEVTKEIETQEIKVREVPAIAQNKSNSLLLNKSVPLKRPMGGGGLSSVLGQIGKKTKISVLEKSKLDWEGFKCKEGLKEELSTFNKGKDGYLQKQDFLQRTDVRQFEIEKSLRQTKRKY